MNILSHIDEMGASVEADAFRELIGDMRQATEVEPSAGLTERIMQGLDKKTGSHRRGRGIHFFNPWLRTAAAAAIIALVFVLRSLYPSSNGSSSSNEQWLASTQELDGSWNPARHGGSQLYQPALTALSALALQQSGPQFKDAVAIACRYLGSIQEPDGSFGGDGRERMYNQAIVTYVLSESCGHKPSYNPILQKAVAFIKASQSVEGGWDYEENSQGNAALTAWAVQALFAAKSCGIADADIPMRKGLRWLRGLTQPNGAVAYSRRSTQTSDTISALAGHALITAGSDFPELASLGQHVVASMTQSNRGESPNLYRDCMKVRALQAAGEVQSANTLKENMVVSTVNLKADQWGNVGGRLYLSSMQSLARTY